MTNKSNAEFQEWDVTRSYVYILDMMLSFVNESNQHNNATPTYWETRANPAELRQSVSKVKKRKRARRGVWKPKRQGDKQKFPIRTERGAVSQPVVGTRFSEQEIILATAPTQLGRDSRLREFGVVLKMDWLSRNGAQIDYKGKKVKIRMPNGKEIVIKGQRQTQKFLNIAQAKQLLRKDSKTYLAYVAGTKREAPITVAYELALPPNLQQVHSVFHVPMLRKYNVDTKDIVKHEDKSVKLFRVLLRYPKVEESTWELESHLRERPNKKMYDIQTKKVNTLIRPDGPDQA
ncbi:hypothetical protein AgCh_006310 [Apium graveolens]